MLLANQIFDLKNLAFLLSLMNINENLFKYFLISKQTDMLTINTGLKCGFCIEAEFYLIQN